MDLHVRQWLKDLVASCSWTVRGFSLYRKINMYLTDVEISGGVARGAIGIPKGQQNLCCTQTVDSDCDCKYVVQNRIFGKVFIPDGCNLENIPYVSALACVNVTCVDPGDGLFGPCCRVVYGQSCLLPVDPTSTPVSIQKPWTLVEGFAGGFGGWKQAVEVMKAIVPAIPWHSVLGIEVDPLIADVYSQNHCAVGYDATDPAISHSPSPILGPACGISNVFRGPICDHVAWMKLLPWDHTLIYSLSAPCPPWSRGRHVKNGLSSLEGQSIGDAIMAARFFRPPLILMENVDAIAEHEHYPVIIGMMRFAGYSLVWQTINDLGKVAPCSRKRWLAAFSRVDLREHCQPIDEATKKGVSMPPTSLAAFRCMPDIPQEHESELTLDDELRSIYSDPRFYKERRFVGSDIQQMVLAARTRDLHSRVATIVASYGAQHLLNPNALVSKGIFAELFRGREGPCFFSPVEHFMMLCGMCDFTFPSSLRLSQTVIGNAIAPPQALLAIAVGCYVMGCLDQMKPNDIILEALLRRRHAGNTKIELYDERILLQLARSETLPTQIDPPTDEENDEILRSPPRKCSRVSAVVITPTVEYETQVQLECITMNGSETFLVPLGVSLQDALKMHGCSFAPLTPIMEGGVIWPRSQKIENDLRLFFVLLEPHQRRWFSSPATWISVGEGFSPLHMLFLELPQVPEELVLSLVRGKFCFDAAFNPIDPRDAVKSQQCVFWHVDPYHEWPIVPCVEMRDRFDSLKATCSHYIPGIAFRDLNVIFSASSQQQMEFQSLGCQSIVRILSSSLPSLGWRWVAKQSDEVCEPFLNDTLTFGALVPIDQHAAPTSVIRLILTRTFLQMAFAFVNAPGCEDVSVALAFQWQGFVIWEGSLPASFSVEYLECIWQLVLMLTFGLEVGCVFQGRRVDFRASLSDLGKLSNGVIRFFLVPALAGGGGKQDLKLECRNALARELLGKQFPLVGLDTLVTNWMDRVGANRLMQTLKLEHDNRRWEQLVDLAKSFGLPYIPADPIRSKAAAVIQKAIRKSRPADVVCSDFSLCDGFFTLSDGGFAPIIPKVEGHTCGVVLLDETNAAPWLDQPLPIMLDEVAIVTLKRVETETNIIPVPITFPATDRFERKVILKGFLWQLGEKDVKFKVADAKQLEVQKSIVLSIQVWKDEAPDEIWNGLSQTFVRTIKDTLSLDSASIWQVWGRSFLGAGPKTSFETASSAQCFFRVDLENVEKFLCKSGTNGIYLTAKADNHLPHPDWNVIWVGSHMQCVCAAQKASSHSGIVRGKTSWGIRCLHSKYTTLSKELRPSFKDHELPVPVTMLFKLQPVPVGIAAAELVSWGESLKWTFRVIKKLGKHAALVGSNVGPPADTFLAINGSVVLVTEISPNKTKRNDDPFVAGPRIRKQSGSNHGNADGAQNFADPWAGASLPSQQSLGSATNAWAKFTPTTDAGKRAQVAGGGGKNDKGVTAPRPIDGPIAQRFQSMEDRMAAFEMNLQQMQGSQQKLGDQVSQFQEKNVAHLRDVDSKVEGLQQSMQGLNAQIQKTIADSVTKQEARIGAQFEEIMAALRGANPAANKPKRSAPGSKQDSEGDEKMSPMKSA